MPEVAPRILFHAQSTFALGGAQARLVALLNAWAEEGADSPTRGGRRYKHLILAMDGRYDAGERFHPAVDWEPVSLPVLRGRGLANRAHFRRHLQATRPDLLLTYNWGAVEWVAANLPQCLPGVHVEDGFGPDEAQSQLPRRQWTRRLLLGLAGGRLAVPSRRLVELGRSWWLPDARISYIPNGVLPAPPGPAKPVWAGERPLVIGTVAGLRPEKNLSRLLRAFAQLRQQRAARLVIVGEGAERPWLEALARELDLGEDLQLTGYVTNPRDWLRGFDLFALSSDTEQQPIALLEAMAEGVPVLSTRVGDVAHMLPAVAAAHGLCEPDDLAFTQALQRVVERFEQWPAWVRAGLEQVEAHYSFARMSNAWQAVFDGRFPALSQSSS